MKGVKKIILFINIYPNKMKNLLLICLLLLSTNIYAQEQAVQSDFSTVDGIINGVYEVISGPAGERDWEFFHSMFYENARLGATDRTKNGEGKFDSFSSKEYQEKHSPMFLRRGFYEEEIGRKENIYGGIAQVFSAYQFRLEEEGDVIMRGINSIQLVFENDRWYITQLIWQAESPAFPLPDWE